VAAGELVDGGQHHGVTDRDPCGLGGGGAYLVGQGAEPAGPAGVVVVDGQGDGVVDVADAPVGVAGVERGDGLAERDRDLAAALGVGGDGLFAERGGEAGQRAGQPRAGAGDGGLVALAEYRAGAYPVAEPPVVAAGVRGLVPVAGGGGAFGRGPGPGSFSPPGGGGSAVPDAAVVPAGPSREPGRSWTVTGPPFR
jgi:hypothetical protein